MINNTEESVCKVNQGYIRKFYNVIAEQSESVARLTKTVTQTVLEYAKSKKSCQ